MKIVDETMFVAVYGSIQLHPWNQGRDLLEDAYSLFYARSNAMGWLSESSSDPTAPSATARWGMNDAGQDWSGGAGTSRVAWFQVALVGSRDNTSLPIQPLLSCVKDVISRVGELRLDGLQLLLPFQAGGVPHRELRSGQNWFAISRRGQGVRVSVTLDGGESEAVQRRVDPIAETLSGLAAGVFSPGHYSINHAMAVELLPPVVGGDWLGDGHYSVTFTGTLPEWSFDALGWTASLFAEACHRNHVRTTVLMSFGTLGASVAIEPPEWVEILNHPLT